MLECGGGAGVVAAVAYNYGRCVAWLRVCVRKSHSDLEKFGERRGCAPCRDDERFISSFSDFYLFLYKCNIRLGEVAWKALATRTHRTATLQIYDWCHLRCDDILLLLLATVCLCQHKHHASENYGALFAAII